jgi:hypothetical protein
LIKILGIELPTFITRLATAILYGFVALVVFLFLPDKIFGTVSSLGVNTSSFVYYAILIVILSGLQGIFRGKFLGDAAAVANGFAQIYYLFIITNGGIMSYYVQQGGINLTIDFRTIMYLLMIPSALGVINAVVHASARVSVQRVETTQELISF